MRNCHLGKVLSEVQHGCRLLVFLIHAAEDVMFCEAILGEPRTCVPAFFSIPIPLGFITRPATVLITKQKLFVITHKNEHV